MGIRGPQNHLCRALVWWTVALCAVTIPAHAATLTVTNNNDSGSGSLRQVLVDANDGDTVTFAVTGSIVLTTGELLVDKSIAISGPGAANLSVDGNASSRVFHIGPDKTVSITGLTIMNGNAGPDDRGAGLYNDHATLTLTNCTISGNSAGFGSGIFNDGFQGSAALQISNSVIDGNVAMHNGGGIFNDADSGGNASLTISSSTLSSNSANNGGGILSDGFDGGLATLIISSSTFNANSADASGGAVYNHGTAGSAALTLSNSTFSGNSAGSFGGGIYNGDFRDVIFNLGIGDRTTANNKGQRAPKVRVSNRTLSSRSAQTLDGRIVAAVGGPGSSSVEISNTTFAGNNASLGGNIHNFLADTGDVRVGLVNTILKAGTQGGNIANDSGSIISHGYNLSSDGCGGFLTGPGDQTNTDPVLGPLQDNGGPTLTHALLPGSAAIDAGDPSFTPPPFYDQRGPGFPRVVNGRVDVGAFEVQEAGVCPQSQGYWKNHPDQWPVTELQLGDVTYNQEELLAILHQPPRGNGLLILAHQEIAAKLNIANGADGSCVQQTLAEADALIGDLVVPPEGNGYLPPRNVSALAETLDEYNEGLLCAPPSCEGTPPPVSAPRSRPMPELRPTP